MGRAQEGRTAGEQAQAQLSALFVTLFISVVGGVFTGFIVKCQCFLYRGQVKGGGDAIQHPLCNPCHSNDQRIWYDDSYYWNVPGQEESGNYTDSGSNSSDEEVYDEDDE